MTTPTHAPITAAIRARIQAFPSYDTISGGTHDGFAPEKTPYPLVVYSLAYAPYEWDWSGPMLVGGYDISVFSRNPVEAQDLDAALANWLSDQPLEISGQSLLYCRRVATLPVGPDLDAEGKKVYQAGGTYEIWTTPARVFVVGISDDAPAVDSV